MLKHGFPPILTKKLLVDPTLLAPNIEAEIMEEGPPTGPSARSSEEDKQWSESNEAKIFYQLVAHTGFIPVPPPLQGLDSVEGGGGGVEDTKVCEHDDDAFHYFENASDDEETMISVDVDEVLPLSVPLHRDPLDHIGNGHTGAVDSGLHSEGDGIRYQPIQMQESVVDVNDDEDNDEFATPSTTPPHPPISLMIVSDEAHPTSRQEQEYHHPTDEAQFTSSRTWARRVVYDLRYLKASRSYGPFLPTQLGREKGRKAMNMNQDTDAQQDDDTDDDDYVFEGAESGTTSSSGSDTDEDDFTDDLLPLLNLLAPQPFPAQTPPPISNQAPTTSESLSLKPDWKWLAAARIIVEGNLREMLQRSPPFGTHEDDENTDEGSSSKVLEEVAKALKRMEGLILGGAPGFWSGWDGQDDTNKTDSKVDPKGKGKEGDVDTNEQGWDWAGVTGTWR